MKSLSPNKCFGSTDRGRRQLLGAYVCISDEVGGFRCVKVFTSTLLLKVSAVCLSVGMLNFLISVNKRQLNGRRACVSACLWRVCCAVELA